MRTGLDRLLAGEGPRLGGVPVALLAHPASVTRELVHAREVLARVGAELVALLGPEHGADAAAQDMEPVDGRREAVPVHSLYGDDERSLWPTPEMFEGARWLVVDLQDVGSRYYTYVWTALMACEVALAEGLDVLLLDRPNPLGGSDHHVEGGAVEDGYESFVGFHDVATRHGMTLAEIVSMALAERGRVSRAPVVLECAGWRRAMTFPDTGLPWVLPSPNMPTCDTAWVYPGQCLWEGTNVSEGRGTTRPFEIFGAPWLDGERLAGALRAEDTPGLSLRPLRFVPTFHKHAGASCGGVQLHVRDPDAVRSLRTTWALLVACWELSGGEMAWRTERYEFIDHIPAIDLLAGGSWLREAVEAGVRAEELERRCGPARQRFLRRRRPFLRYD